MGINNKLSRLFRAGEKKTEAFVFCVCVVENKDFNRAEDWEARIKWKQYTAT